MVGYVRDAQRKLNLQLMKCTLCLHIAQKTPIRKMVFCVPGLYGFQTAKNDFATHLLYLCRLRLTIEYVFKELCGGREALYRFRTTAVALRFYFPSIELQNNEETIGNLVRALCS